MKWEIAWEAQPGRPRAATSTLPPRSPTPSQSLFRPFPDSALETTSPTYPLLLQIPCRETVAPTPVLARSGREQGEVARLVQRSHNGSSNRLRRRQPLRELRSRATGLGGWERANEEEGVEREQGRPAGPTHARQESRPSLGADGRKCACVLVKSPVVGGRGGEDLGASPVKERGCELHLFASHKTIRSSEVTFLLSRVGCEEAIVVLCCRNRGVRVWKSSLLLCRTKSKFGKGPALTSASPAWKRSHVVWPPNAGRAFLVHHVCIMR
ncbi:hypothetical protein J1605_018547 [Eschrichtius robustus]|uniref:Uncharacterized protein n=1 Tax=Eschrichtius robustus TaxID=9764 RepID=A0AB34HVY4_ESCRO|nr:hypothetical protein J1605_018547 [Eschrichtius robustus]